MAIAAPPDSADARRVRAACEQTATRDECLRAWRLPSETPPPNDYAQLEDFYVHEVIGSPAEDMPRAAAVQPVRGRDFDVESSVAKLRRTR